MKVLRSEEFVVGEVIEVGGYIFRVEKIKMERKMFYYGKVRVDEIVVIMGY